MEFTAKEIVLVTPGRRDTRQQCERYDIIAPALPTSQGIFSARWF